MALDTPNNLSDLQRTAYIEDPNRAGKPALTVSVTSMASLRGTLTDRSGTVTAGGTAQTVMVANANRNFFMFENVSSSDLWINFGATAVLSQPSIKVVANGSITLTGNDFVSTQLVSVIGATTGQAFTAKEG